ncbi:MAG: IS110 family transposase [Rhodanobacteraceae bacterium]
MFQVAAENARGEVVWEERLTSRRTMQQFIAKLEPPLTVVIETGPGAQAWAREIQTRSAQVKILPAQHTAAHRSGQKNDARDSYAILRAAHDRSVHPVPVKTREQLSMQALHRARRGWQRRMAAISNQVRGRLLEQGVVIAKGDAARVRTVDTDPGRCRLAHPGSPARVDRGAEGRVGRSS